MLPPAFEDQAACQLVFKPGFINALGRQCVVDVGQCENPAAEGNLLAAQASRVAAAVEAFVVGHRDVVGHAEELRALVGLRGGVERFAADDRMPLHDLEFLGREPSGLEQHPIRNPDLPDVVQRAGEVE